MTDWVWKLDLKVLVVLGGGGGGVLCIVFPYRINVTSGELRLRKQQKAHWHPWLILNLL